MPEMDGRLIRVRVVVFAAGAVVMGLEMAASRVLAPYFGSSVYVWGSLIGVFLAALSGGYSAGGRVADRWPHPGVLGSILLGAGGLILLLPALSPVLLDRLTRWDFGPRLGPLLATLLLFTAPGILLGVVSPFAVKLVATDLATVGNVAGSLYATSTVGSIAGTLLTAFVLIPALGVQTILYLLSGTLLVSSALLAPAARPLRGALIALLAGAWLLTPSWRTPTVFKTVYENSSFYHRIRVVQDQRYLYLTFDRSYQGGMRLDDPFESPYPYTDYMSLAWLFQPQITRVLVIGLGAGTIPKRFWRDYPDLTVTAVELDPAVVYVALRFFSVKEDSRMRLVVQDGREYLRRTRETFDLIIVDAYFAEGIPFHLATREFFQLVRAHLRPGGIVAANIVGALEGQESTLFRALYNTYDQVFPGLYLFPVGYLPERRGSRVRTIVLLGAPEDGLGRAELRARVRRLRADGAVRAPSLEAYVANFYDRPIVVGDVPVLTDDYAPVDILPVYGWEPERR